MAKRGGIAARSAPFGGKPKSVSARLRGASGLDREGRLPAAIDCNVRSESLRAASKSHVTSRDGVAC